MHCLQFSHLHLADENSYFVTSHPCNHDLILHMQRKKMLWWGQRRIFGEKTFVMHGMQLSTNLRTATLERGNGGKSANWNAHLDPKESMSLQKQVTCEIWEPWDFWIQRDISKWMVVTRAHAVDGWMGDWFVNVSPRRKDKATQRDDSPWAKEGLVFLHSATLLHPNIFQGPQ